MSERSWKKLVFQPPHYRDVCSPAIPAARSEWELQLRHSARPLEYASLRCNHCFNSSFRRRFFRSVLCIFHRLQRTRSWLLRTCRGGRRDSDDIPTYIQPPGCNAPLVSSVTSADRSCPTQRRRGIAEEEREERRVCARATPRHDGGSQPRERICARDGGLRIRRGCAVADVGLRDSV